ncbi:MAG: Fic family protein, partial [Pseudohongiellaceae bacterium]
DVPALMHGLLALAGEYQKMGNGNIHGNNAQSPDPVLMAAAIAFGFVYIHPFEDGNGRIHRYLIHDVLAKAGFTPRGIVLPVSSVILTNLDDYIATLEQFSRPLNQRTHFDPGQLDLPATGNDAVYFRYPDLTAQAEFLYKALQHTVTHDLQQEIDYLLGFDRASKALNNLLDWPGHSLELFIRVVQENGGTLSANKRRGHFEWMRDDEIKAAESLVSAAFTNGSDKDGS